MYIIKVDGNAIYFSENATKDITSAKLSLKTNSSSSLEFTAIKGSSAYDSMNMLKSIVEVYRDDTRLFLGRGIKESIDFNNIKTISCEGVLGYLYDSIQRPHDFLTDDSYTSLSSAQERITYIFTYLLNVHNNQVEDYKKIYPGEVTVTDTTEDETYSSDTHDPDDPKYMYQYENGSSGSSSSLETSYNSTFDALNNLLINNLTGYLYVREVGGKIFLDYLKEFKENDGQIIAFGTNLLDYSSSMDFSSICTGVLPLGGSGGSSTGDDNDPYNMYQTDEDGRLTIKGVNDDSDILWNETAVEHFGKIVKAVEWSSVTDPTTLKQKANNYLIDKQYKNLSIECKVVDLHFINNSYKPLEFEHLVRVISQPHGLDKEMPITAMEYDLMNPANDTVTLGKTYNTATQILQQSTK